MLDSNASHVVAKLDELRKNEKKFVCINDNMNHDSDDIEIIQNLIQDFFLTFFPKRSGYELSSEYRNRKFVIY